VAPWPEESCAIENDTDLLGLIPGPDRLPPQEPDPQLTLAQMLLRSSARSGANTRLNPAGEYARTCRQTCRPPIAPGDQGPM
jgi:hypothetical protein